MKRLNKNMHSKGAILLLTLSLASCSHQQHPVPSQTVTPSVHNNQNQSVPVAPWTPPDPSLVAGVANPVDRADFLEALTYFPPEARENITFLNVDAHTMYATHNKIPMVEVAFYDPHSALPQSINGVAITNELSSEQAFLRSTMFTSSSETPKSPTQMQQEFVNCTDNTDTGTYFRMSKAFSAAENVNWMHVKLHLPKYNVYFNIPDFNKVNLYSSNNLIQDKKLKYINNTPHIYIGGLSINPNNGRVDSDSLDLGFMANTGQYDGDSYNLKGGWSLFIRDEKTKSQEKSHGNLTIANGSPSISDRFAEDSDADLYFYHKDNLLFVFASGKAMDGGMILTRGMVIKASQSNWDKADEINIYKIMVSMAQSYLGKGNNSNLASIFRNTAKLDEVSISNIEFGKLNNPDKQGFNETKADDGNLKVFSNIGNFIPNWKYDNRLEECVFPKKDEISKDFIRANRASNGERLPNQVEPDFNLSMFTLDNLFTTRDDYSKIFGLPNIFADKIRYRAMDFTKEHKTKLSL